MVAFKMAELYSELVQAVVVSGSVLAIEECMISRAVENIGFSSCSEMLLPSSNEGLRTLLSVALYRNIQFPNRILSDLLKIDAGSKVLCICLSTMWKQQIQVCSVTLFSSAKPSTSYLFMEWICPTVTQAYINSVEATYGGMVSDIYDTMGVTGMSQTCIIKLPFH